MKKRMKQSKLVLLTSVISVILLIIIGILFGWNLNVTSLMSKANTDRMDLYENANRFMNGSAYLTNEVRAYAATGDQTHYDNYWNEVNTLKNRDNGIANMQNIGITAEEQAMINEMSSLSNNLVPLEEQAMKDTAAGKTQSALDFVYGPEYEKSIAKINQIKTDFVNILIQRTNSQVKLLGEIQSLCQLLIILALLAIICIQIVIYLLIIRKVIRPIVAVQKEMGEIAVGNLSSSFLLEADTSEIGMLVQSIHSTKDSLKQYIQDISAKLGEMAKGNFALSVELDYIGDFGPIKDAIAHILDSLNDAMGQIDQTAAQVSVGADQVSSGAQALAQGATEQASSVEELSATIAELSHHVRQNADSADHARDRSLLARAEVSGSNTHLQEMMDAMNNISRKSEEIGKIIKTIEDIAFQTNILALNAAVEAARAGTAGKGFAVVADEVRNLAGKSAEAAKSTTTLIQQTLDAVQSGVTIADGTALAMQRVVESSDTVSDLIQEIAKATGEQSGALSQVAQGVEQISSVVQTNSATAEESAAASQELSDQSQTLKNLVARFNLRRADTMRLASPR